MISLCLKKITYLFILNMPCVLISGLQNNSDLCMLFGERIHLCSTQIGGEKSIATIWDILRASSHTFKLGFQNKEQGEILAVLLLPASKDSHIFLKPGLISSECTHLVSSASDGVFWEQFPIVFCFFHSFLTEWIYPVLRESLGRVVLYYISYKIYSKNKFYLCIHYSPNQ